MANIVFTPNQNAWVNPEFFANLYKQRRDLLDAEQTKADATLDTLSTLQAKLQATQDADGNWIGKDAKQAQILQGYIDSATNISNSITSRNASIGDIKRDARNLRIEIIPTTTKYVDMLAARDKILSEANKEGYRYSKNFIDKDLEYFGNDENLLYNTYKISEFSDAGKDIMKRYNAMQTPTVTHSRTDRPDKKLLTMTQGISEMPTEGNVYNTLLSEAKKYVESQGVSASSNPTLYNELINDVMEGMSGGLATPTYSLVDDALYKSNALKAQDKAEARKKKEATYTGMYVNVPTYYNDNNVEYSGTEEQLKESTNAIQGQYNRALATFQKTIDSAVVDYLTEDASKEYDKLKKEDASKEDIAEFLTNDDNYKSGMSSDLTEYKLNAIQELKNLKSKIKNKDKGYYYDSSGTRYQVGTKFSENASEGMAGTKGVHINTKKDGDKIKTQKTYTMDSNFKNFAAIEDYNVQKIESRIQQEINSLLETTDNTDLKMPEIKIHHDGKDYKMTIKFAVGEDEKAMTKKQNIISRALLNIKYDK